MKASAPVGARTGESPVKVSPWCNSASKRAWDLFWASFLLLLFSPFMLIAALAVRLTSHGPILFRQRRPGRDGIEFTIFKFRTMIEDRPQAGPVLTRARDPRVTWFGRHLRRWKLDELPQLFNVVRGEMSFIGPRPQPSPLWKEPSIQEDASVVLSVRPGITSTATLAFRNEEEVLAPLRAEQVEEVYLRTLMPLKLKMEVEYLKSATFGTDWQILMRTFGRIFKRRHEDDDFLKQCLPDLKVSAPADKAPALTLLPERRDVRTIATSAPAEEKTGT